MFLSPGTWAAVIWMLFFSVHSQIGFVKWWHMCEWEAPNLLMHPIVVVLSENTLMWIFSSFMKDFKPRGMAFSSRAFICHCFSCKCQAPLLIYPHMRPPNPHLRHQCIWPWRFVGVVSSLMQILCYLSITLNLELHPLIVSPYIQNFPLTFSVHMFYIYPMLYSTGGLTCFQGK